MNKEILELSQWLHEKGFEPDMVKQSGSDFILRLNRGYGSQPLVDRLDGFGHKYCDPYFTLNRALELLFEYQIPYKRFLTLAHGTIDFSDDEGNVLDFEVAPSIDRVCIKKDYHLAALRLLKQVVEKGYLKGESDAIK